VPILALNGDLGIRDNAPVARGELLTVLLVRIRQTWPMEQGRGFSTEEARQIGERIGIDWARSAFDIEQFRMGLEVELEHGRRDPATNVSDDDEITTGKIAWAHLNEFPDYYTRLASMEAEAERYWAERRPGSSS
jgi:hypothetical protein